MSNTQLFWHQPALLIICIFLVAPAFGGMASTHGSVQLTSPYFRIVTSESFGEYVDFEEEFNDALLWHNQASVAMRKVQRWLDERIVPLARDHQLLLLNYDSTLQEVGDAGKTTHQWREQGNGACTFTLKLETTHARFVNLPMSSIYFSVSTTALPADGPLEGFKSQLLNLLEMLARDAPALTKTLCIPNDRTWYLVNTKDEQYMLITNNDDPTLSYYYTLSFYRDNSIYWSNPDQGWEATSDDWVEDDGGSGAFEIDDKSKTLSIWLTEYYDYRVGKAKTRYYWPFKVKKASNNQILLQLAE